MECPGIDSNTSMPIKVIETIWSVAGSAISDYIKRVKLRQRTDPTVLPRMLSFTKDPLETPRSSTETRQSLTSLNFQKRPLHFPPLHLAGDRSPLLTSWQILSLLQPMVASASTFRSVNGRLLSPWAPQKSCGLKWKDRSPRNGLPSDEAREILDVRFSCSVSVSLLALPKWPSANQRLGPMLQNVPSSCAAFTQ